MTDESLKLICAAMIGRAAVDGGKKRYKKDVQDFLNSQWGKNICEGLETTMKICDHINQRVDANEIQKCIDEGKVNIAYIKLINGGKQ